MSGVIATVYVLSRRGVVEGGGSGPSTADSGTGVEVESGTLVVRVIVAIVGAGI